MARHSKARLGRRSFLKATAAAVAAPYIVPSTVFGQNAPSNRIVLGSIGMGGMGKGDTNSLINCDGVQCVAVCDVDAQRAQQGKGLVDKRHGNSDCKTYSDWREVIARDDIDVIMCATPDHWHGLIGIAAMQAGKDVYGEKPITHTFREGKALYETQKKHNRIWQTGSQQRSDEKFRRASELAINGVLGKIKLVEVGLPRGNAKPPQVPDAPVPDHLDYEMYCGPSPKLPYNPKRLHWDWRWCYNFGGGQMMDWIGHHNDIAPGGLGEELGGPVEVEAVDFKYPDDTRLWDAPYEYEVRCLYANGTVTSISHKYRNGLKYIGENGWCFVSRGKIEASNPDWIKQSFDRGPKKLYATRGHHRNFIDCVRSREQTICPAEVSHRSITPGHLGIIAERVGRKIKWDPKTETILGDAEATKLLHNDSDRMPLMPMRAPWKLG